MSDPYWWIDDPNTFDRDEEDVDEPDDFDFIDAFGRDWPWDVDDLAGAPGN